MLLAVGILQLKKHQSPNWHSFNEKEEELLAELRWGLQYFIKWWMSQEEYIMM